MTCSICKQRALDAEAKVRELEAERDTYRCQVIDLSEKRDRRVKGLEAELQLFEKCEKLAQLTARTKVEQAVLDAMGAVGFHQLEIWRGPAGLEPRGVLDTLAAAELARRGLK